MWWCKHSMCIMGTNLQWECLQHKLLLFASASQHFPMIALSNMDGDVSNARCCFYSVVALTEELWPGLSCVLGLPCGCVSQDVLSPSAGLCRAQTVPTGLSSKHPQPSCPAGGPSTASCSVGVPAEGPPLWFGQWRVWDKCILMLHSKAELLAYKNSHYVVCID